MCATVVLEIIGSMFHEQRQVLGSGPVKLPIYQQLPPMLGYKKLCVRQAALGLVPDILSID